MKAHGHHSVAEIAGEPLLKAAFRGIYGENVPLDAFYLGNWITDVAQSYDPVALVTGKPKLLDAIDWIFDNVPPFFIKDKGREELSTDLICLEPQTKEQIYYQMRVDTKATAETFVSQILAKQGDGTSLYFKAAQNSFFFLGYLKFVHPKEDKGKKGDGPTSKPLRMNMDMFVEVFNEMFKGYWPHDHMDRPPLLPPPQASGVVPYDSRRPLPDPANDNKEPPGLYTYMREFTTLAAADLAHLDLTWAHKYILEPPPPERRHEIFTDPAWHVGLAKLGRALHVIEDYFAHSNYIEHAAKVMGGQFIPHRYQYDNWRFLKRLKRLTEPDNSKGNWHDGPDEPHVVSGYFDLRDTVISLSHLGEDRLLGLIGREPKDITLFLREMFDYGSDPDHADNVIENQANAIVSDILEVITEPRKAFDNEQNLFRQVVVDVLVPAADADDFVEAVGTIKQRLNTGTPADQIEYFRFLFKHLPIFSQLESMRGRQLSAEHFVRIYSALILYLRYMSIEFAISDIPVSFKKIVERLALFAVAPQKAIKEWIKSEIVNMSLDAATYFAKEALFEAIAADRIGCHSLLGKDHGKEWLYKPMRNCTLAAHHYIMRAMLRWTTYSDTVPAEPNRYIDWDHIVEHIIEHPAKGVVFTKVHPVPFSFMHQLTPAQRERPMMDVVKDLAKQYSPFTYKPATTPDSGPFREQTIIWGNMQMVIKDMKPAAVAESTLGNMILPGLGTALGIRRIVIPYMKYKLGVAVPTEQSRRWYMSVIPRTWDPKTGLPALDMMHTPRYHPSFTVAKAKADNAVTLRAALEARYRA